MAPDARCGGASGRRHLLTAQPGRASVYPGEERGVTGDTTAQAPAISRSEVRGPAESGVPGPCGPRGVRCTERPP